MKLVAKLLVLSLLAGCSSPADDGDPGASSDGTPAADPATNPGSSPGAGTGEGTPIGASPANPGSGTTNDGGSASTSDAAAPADGGSPAPAAGGPFAGAPAYKATLGPSTLIKRHVFNGDNPAGQACLSCHTGEKGIPKFLFAGTVYADAAGTKPAASVEVRVRDAAGLGRSAYTDANGNFFFRQDNLPPLAAPATAGVRNATTTHAMTNAINDGSCNSCHREGGEGRLHLP